MPPPSSLRLLILYLQVRPSHRGMNVEADNADISYVQLAVVLI